MDLPVEEVFEIADCEAPGRPLSQSLGERGFCRSDMPRALFEENRGDGFKDVLPADKAVQILREAGGVLLAHPA